ncbi:GTPase HflX [Deinococcus cellulosilyticus]|uniref:GTPase HflX n=1 Tax=Deinococcus cellulosilyticus (strain DSM 18568 / NBRC 106333 / KACC 11606 / 5516J-15) TaxID=1223518 RepID=A0A511N8S3_DEIC1|nr:GTPase HflX [Deinococcus cellulosilyticus]GEM48886.1 GTPase HflX [Deinococcus cellulosilyticus NBRC 106333 = KACC 11606]
MVVTPELARAMSELSTDMRREVAVVIDRRGHVLTVSVGDAANTDLPPVKHSENRLSGFHLVHTHPRGGALSKSDLSTLFLNRLDAICAIEVKDGLPGKAHVAHLTPPNSVMEEEDWRILAPQTVHELEDWDLQGQVRALEEEFARFRELKTQKKDAERALLVQVDSGEFDAEDRLAELSELARTAGAVVVHKELVFRKHLNPSSVIGKGKLEELTSRAYHLDASMIIFGQELSPAQAREIENVTNLKILDRTQLILDIFALHASGTESKLQVELAQLRYMKPRLLGKGTQLSRIGGSGGSAGGAIGTRGPGETKLELDRRYINDRISELDHQIEELSRRREERRKARARNRIPVVGIVGYTNAGKSTLLNALLNQKEDKKVLAENKLFATLRPTSRQVFLQNYGQVILTDTVGFIRDLPKDLARAFKATLEEIGDANLLMHVLDASAPDFEIKFQSVQNILKELELTDIPVLVVLNKADQASQERLEDLKHRYSGLAVSALTGEGITDLKRELIGVLTRHGLETSQPEFMGTLNAYHS